MNSTHICRVIVMVTIAATLNLSGQSRAWSRDSAPKSTLSVSELSWMSGDWQTETSRAVSEEHWTRPAGGSMIGMSRTLVGDKTVSFEYLRLEQRPDAIYYVASPNGRCPATDFKLTRLSGKEAIFENPEHDFPKRIIYRKNSEGTLSATIDGGEGTKSEKFVFRPISK